MKRSLIWWEEVTKFNGSCGATARLSDFPGFAAICASSVPSVTHLSPVRCAPPSRWTLIRQHLDASTHYALPPINVNICGLIPGMVTMIMPSPAGASMPFQHRFCAVFINKADESQTAKEKPCLIIVCKACWKDRSPNLVSVPQQPVELQRLGCILVPPTRHDAPQASLMTY